MKTKLLILLFVLGLGFSVVARQPIKNHLPQNDSSKYGKDSATCVMNLSLYRESYRLWRASHYKNTSINDITKPWRWCFLNCPRSSENLYVDGVKIFKYRIRKTQNEKTKDALIDTLMMIFDQRLKYFPNHYKTHKSQKGIVLGRKGVALYQLKPKDYEEAYPILKKSIELEKQNSKGAVLIYYFRTITKMAMAGKIDTVQVVDAYDQISNYIDAGIKKYKALGNTKKLAEYESFKGNIDDTFDPFATCTDLVRIYQKKLDAAPNDIDLLKKIIYLLEKKRCVESSLYFNANISLYKADPSPESAYLIGKMMLNKKRYADAIAYLQSATKMEDKEKVDDAYMFLAMAYRVLNKFVNARNMALKAVEINPHNGNAYFLIGDMYAESASKCGSNDLTSKVAYWAAVDKFIQAKKADPELTDVMNKRIAIYKAHFPTTETLFFYNIKVGDKYTVPCWINEVTIVRASN